MEIFFATTALKKDNGVDDPTVKPRPVEKVVVLGAGLMGVGHRLRDARRAGIPVRMKDRDDAARRAAASSASPTSSTSA